MAELVIGLLPGFDGKRTCTFFFFLCEAELRASTGRRKSVD